MGDTFGIAATDGASWVLALLISGGAIVLIVRGMRALIEKSWREAVISSAFGVLVLALYHGALPWYGWVGVGWLAFAFMVRVQSTREGAPTESGDPATREGEKA